MIRCWKKMLLLMTVRRRITRAHLATATTPLILTRLRTLKATVVFQLSPADGTSSLRKGGRSRAGTAPYKITSNAFSLLARISFHCPGIEGLARAIHLKSSRRVGRLFAGIWEGDLAFGLMWKMMNCAQSLPIGTMPMSWPPEGPGGHTYWEMSEELKPTAQPSKFLRNHPQSIARQAALGQAGTPGCAGNGPELGRLNTLPTI